MTSRPTASGLLLLVCLTGCTWGSKPELPLTGGDARDASTSSDRTELDGPAEDAWALPDIPVVPDAAGASDARAPGGDAAPASDGGPFPPPQDAAVLDDCRFVSSADGLGRPDGAVEVDGGYFVNARGESCTPRERDAGGDVTDAASDAGDAGAAGAAGDADGGRP